MTGTGDTDLDRLDTAIRAAARRCPGVLTVAVRCPGGTRYGHRGDERLRPASSGKLLLLAEAACRISDGSVDADEAVRIGESDLCGGTGLLRQLSARRWTVGDLALLTAAVSDNTATNALLGRLDRQRVNATAHTLGLTATRLLDRVRDVRGPGDAPAFATGTADDLARLTWLVAGDALPVPGAAGLLLYWLRTNTDHTLVPALLPHDPYEPGIPGRAPPGTVWTAGKTGTDAGVRAEAGVMIGAHRVGYAVLTNGEPGTEPGLVASVREVGVAIARHAAGWLG